MRKIQSERRFGGETFSSKLRNSRYGIRRLIYGAFQCEVELDYITVSRLLLVPVGKCLREH